MHLSELQNKDVLNLNDGKVMGKIVDVIINDNGSIEKIVVEKYRFIISWFTTHTEAEILWQNINKIGEDVIFVNYN